MEEQKEHKTLTFNKLIKLFRFIIVKPKKKSITSYIFKNYGARSLQGKFWKK